MSCIGEEIAQAQDRMPVTVADLKACNGRRDALTELAFGLLMVRFMAATASPLSRIPTPGWVDSVTPPAVRDERAHTRLIDVISDQLGGRDSDAAWCELVTALTKSPDGLAWLRKQGQTYATYHEESEAA